MKFSYYDLGSRKNDLTTVLTTIVVVNNGIVGLTDAKRGGFTYQKGLFLL